MLTDGITDGRKDGRMNGQNRQKLYTPSASYAGGIKIISKPHALLQSLEKTRAKFQKDLYKIV